MEARLGADFSTVRIHSDPAAERSATAVDAGAYTSGEHIVGGPGALDRRTIAHELTHVLQQRSGPVAGNDHGGGLRVSDPSDRFEREADANAQRVMDGPAAAEPQSRPASHEPASGPGPGTSARPSVQRAVIQRWTDGTMQGDPPKVTEDGGRAHIVEVDNLRGRTLNTAHNPPSVEPIGWANLRAAGLALGGDKPKGAPYHAVRMHLWNGRLGGPGKETWNLAPGPAQVNSLMSKQAEDPVKNLVDSGHRVWLRTEVNYGLSPANDAVYSSTVPNHISMVWKVQGNPSLDDSWQSPILVPGEPLQGTAKIPYQNWTGTAADLVTDLMTKDDQTRAQVISLVPTRDLKVAILQGYPDVYRDISSATQADLLGWLYDANTQVADVGTFLTSVALATHELVEHALEPLSQAGRTQLVDALFTLSAPTDKAQREMVFKHRNLIKIVGNPLTNLAKRDYTIFEKYSKESRMGLMEEMHTANELADFPLIKNPSKKRKRLSELDNWATEHNNSKRIADNARARLAFMTTKTNVPSTVLEEYEDWTETMEKVEERKSKPTHSRAVKRGTLRR
ncbi:DUF4157 domain-containing protein [Streptomyces sp. NPDC001027]|uniref:eCIS core domain-containing protein n=1 Tax=Streptomyces sp. NPDC001027 TaxID=3154771 RepID=UPI00331C7D24